MLGEDGSGDHPSHEDEATRDDDQVVEVAQCGDGSPGRVRKAGCKNARLISGPLAMGVDDTTCDRDYPSRTPRREVQESPILVTDRLPSQQPRASTIEVGMLSFPMKYLSAGALFFNGEGGILVVKPTYKDGWEIPGGIVEQDESPVQACRREIREELGLEIAVASLLVADHVVRRLGASDSLQMVFAGGTLTPEQISAIRLPAAELAEYQFVAPDAALRLLPDSLSRRVAGCLRALAESRTLLLHEGIEE